MILSRGTQLVTSKNSLLQPALPRQLQLQVPAMHTAAFKLNNAVKL